MRQMIKDIQQRLKITTIFVTHDQEEALSISDRIFIMEKGEIVQQGTPQDIYSVPKTKFVAGFLGTFNFFDPEFLKEEGKKQILVRPEHIGILNTDEGYDKDCIYKGIVNQLYFLGNVVRISVLVDTLNKDIKQIKRGQDILLNIDRSKYIYLE